MIFRFSITQDAVDRFVDLTGDRNSMHVSDAFARRMRFRRRVVHGMIPFAHLLLIERMFDGRAVDLCQCQCKFLKPVFVGDCLSLQVETGQPDGTFIPFDASWVNEKGGDVVIRARGAVAAISAESQESAAGDRTSFVTAALTENDLSIDELAARSESIAFAISDPLKRRFAAEIIQVEDGARPAAGNNFLSTVMLSTLVGMRLPGRYATFSGFQVNFNQSTPSKVTCQWSGTVQKATVVTESAELSIELTAEGSGEPIATGAIQSMVNPRARQIISCQEIRERYLDVGLAGKVAIVTGSSRGIGAATAKLMAMHGAKVVVNYNRGQADAEAVAADIQSAGGAAIALQCDVADELQVQTMMQRAASELGGVHLLINNAVKDAHARDALDLSWEEFLTELEVTLKGVHNCCRAAVPHMRAHGGGKIINLSTIYVDNPVKGQAKYITAKSAVVGYTRSLARELAAENIQVNLVSPNMTTTDLLAGLPSEIIRRMGQQRAGKRNLEPIEVAQAIVFLASQWSNSMNGQKLVLNLGEPPFA